MVGVRIQLINVVSSRFTVFACGLLMKLDEYNAYGQLSPLSQVFCRFLKLLFPFWRTKSANIITLVNPHTIYDVHIHTYSSPIKTERCCVPKNQTACNLMTLLIFHYDNSCMRYNRSVSTVRPGNKI